MSFNDLDFTNKVLYFIHIPKTSGSAFESKQIIKLGHRFNVPNLYRTPKDKRGFHEYITDKWSLYTYPRKNHYKITIIRNPFDLLCSYYHHGEKLKLDGSYSHSGWASVNYTHQFKTFKEFITAYCDPSFTWHMPAFKNFLFSQLFNINSNCIVDIIIKYEYRDEAIDMLNIKLTHKINKNIRRNVSNKENYKKYYDQEMIDLVYKKCDRELKYFNYDFNGSTKYEPLIINPTIKYDVYNNKIIE
jgi:hypothetical protein